ncbi:MAG: hypothetical protein HC772_07175 [Leptolyngbyaceae cyanobacterium CRU_2_3]|nr:hypothetical protein [Leptolyngbyaceae cyanobacterium CRU_2_3]
MGRSPYQEAIRRSDGGALIQALGTRGSDQLEINVQRFVIEEDGLLLLCSDGLSDYDRVEQFWQAIARSVFKDKTSVQSTAQAWISLANQLNGHDNTSVVLLRCLVSDSSTQPINTEPVSTEPVSAAKALLPDLKSEPLADSSRALLYDDEDTKPPIPDPNSSSISQFPWEPAPSGTRLMALLVLVLAAGILGWAILLQMVRSSQSQPSQSQPSQSQPSQIPSP